MSFRPKLSICIPAYNRSKFLSPLLDSILSQDFTDFEIVICEDCSPERDLIAAIARDYICRYPKTIKYYENQTNLGYDGNIRNLIEHSTGQYCFFMGNDDLMCQGALSEVAQLIESYPNVGLILKSYAWFDSTPDKVNQEVRYFSEVKYLQAGREAISVCYRRSGVISGYIVERESAVQSATDEFDGTLYYQMHLTASILQSHGAVATPKVLVLCRNTEPPDFGNSAKEKAIYTPGRYTPQARLRMITGVISIIRAFDRRTGENVSELVMRDYANYFYPYIKDQLKLPVAQYISLCKGYGKLGFYRFPMFYIYCVIAYILKEDRFDMVTRFVRRSLGRSPQLGMPS